MGSSRAHDAAEGLTEQIQPLQPAIWLGDLVRSVAVLEPEDNRSSEAIARVLGFGWRGHPLAAAASFDERDAGAKGAAEQGAPVARGRERRPAAEPSTARSRAIAQVLTPLRTEPREQSHVWEAQRPLEVFSDTRHARRSLAHEPLFVPRATRELIVALASTFAALGSIDVERTIRAIAAARPLHAVPKLHRPSLRLGVQVLLDVGIGMEPFTRDQTRFVAAIRSVVGRSHVETAQFVGCPARGALAWPYVEWRPYRRPDPGQPALALTDLGIGSASGPDHGTPAEWLAFAQALARQNSPLVALVPYPRSRWPQPLQGRITIVQWDRPTTVGHTRIALGRGVARR